MVDQGRPNVSDLSQALPPLLPFSRLQTGPNSPTFSFPGGSAGGRPSQNSLWKTDADCTAAEKASVSRDFPSEIVLNGIKTI